MRVLVTGGAGFIGSNFVHLSREQRPDAQITVLDKLTYAGTTRSLDGVEDDITFVEGDVADRELVDRLVAPCTGCSYPRSFRHPGAAGTAPHHAAS